MLTPSEYKVLSAFSEVNHTKKVAKKLNRTVRTINFHCANINEKFGTNLISKSCLKAIKAGMVPLPKLDPIDLSILTPTQLAIAKELLDNNLDMTKVIDNRCISKRTLDYHLYQARLRTGAFDTLDLILMVMVSL